MKRRWFLFKELHAPRTQQECVRRQRQRSRKDRVRTRSSRTVRFVSPHHAAVKEGRGFTPTSSQASFMVQPASWSSQLHGPPRLRATPRVHRGLTARGASRRGAWRQPGGRSRQPCPRRGWRRHAAKRTSSARRLGPIVGGEEDDDDDDDGDGSDDDDDDGDPDGHGDSKTLGV